MTNEEKRRVRDTIEEEGFAYAFVSCSEFGYVADEKFHELRRAYVAAHAVLQRYVGNDYNDPLED